MSKTSTSGDTEVERALSSRTWFRMICQDDLTGGCHRVPLAAGAAGTDEEEETADDEAAVAATEEELDLVVTTGMFEEVRAAEVATGLTVVDP